MHFRLPQGPCGDSSPTLAASAQRSDKWGMATPISSTWLDHREQHSSGQEAGESSLFCRAGSQPSAYLAPGSQCSGQTALTKAGLDHLRPNSSCFGSPYPSIHLQDVTLWMLPPSGSHMSTFLHFCDFSSLLVPLTPPQQLELRHFCMFLHLQMYLSCDFSLGVCLANGIKNSVENPGFADRRH